MKSPIFLRLFTLILGTVLLFQSYHEANGQRNDEDLRASRIKAIDLSNENRYLDAYPFLEKIASSFPSDREVWTHYGIAIAVRSVTLPDANKRKEERRRASMALAKAKELGTTNVIALELLDQLGSDGGAEDNFLDQNPEVEKALREGEAYFAKGEYGKAFALYERAYKLNPKSYEAALFAGDTFYAQKKYRESEPWFETAATINPDREMAFRFWGDALLEQGKVKDAQDKFVEAFIAEPYSRYAWDNVDKLTRKYGKYFDVKGVFPPGTNDFGEIIVDLSGLSEKDGSYFWMRYVESKKAWRSEKFAKTFKGSQYRETLNEMVESLRAVLAPASAAIKSGRIKTPHHSLKNLIEIESKGFLESYILLLAATEEVSEDYYNYRLANRATLRKFLNEHVFVLKDGKDEAKSVASSLWHRR